MNISNNKILITGGASGIGLGLTRRFLEEGNSILICGRREAALAEIRSEFPSVITFAADLATEQGRIALYEWISNQHPDLEVLINNAGIQQWMNLDDPDFYQRAKEEMAINIEAPIHLVSLFSKLESLKTIINVTSGLAFSPLTKTPVYGATKAFLHSFTLSIRHLLKPKGIDVIEFIPPALNTDLGGKGLHDFAPPVSDFIDAVFTQLKEGKTEITFGFSEAIANAGPEELKKAFERMNNPS